MYLRKATLEDQDAIMNIVNQAKLYFKNAGINQWQQGYPNEQSLEEDIQKGRSYVYCDDNNTVCATAALCFGIEPDYNKIYDGKWKSNLDYAAIHRVAVSDNLKGRGIAKEFVCEMFKICKQHGLSSVRIDTHEKNISMQKMLAKSGFEYCGIIYLSQNGDARNAYELIL